ncbi:MAG: extracellular solute-binding protein [Firmicutes bacterium]|uniref:Extracellular solute-binding protein n=1 Tax=Candidatus Alloenteromonas pullistercoris TaxID=2840785 RepID=A0A9D9DDG7_9FIRM|nr:extracellular solute-binding protein [Candidatus Enteromonas pullistercoris]
MKTKQLLVAMTALVGVTAVTGCDGGDTTRESGVLSVLAYNGGYGDEWINEIASEFTRQTGIAIVPSVDSSLLTTIESELVSRYPKYDIIMSHGIGWQSYANRGLVAELDDLYESTNDDGDVFADRVVDEGLELSSYKAYRQDEAHYYKVPFTQGAGGLVYNVDMFEEHGWAVPNSYADLVSLCAEIAADEDGILPFAWAGGSRAYYWDYVVYSWWYELAGEDVYNQWLSQTGSDGTYDTGIENYNPDTSGSAFSYFKQAYQMWYDLVATHPEYSNENAYGANLMTAQNLFINGQAAMIPYGTWAKKEIENNTGKSFNFDVAMMPTPNVNDGETHYNFMVGFGDSMIIPAHSPNIELAKEFLSFMSTEYACKSFVKYAEGPFLGFNYDDVDMSDITANDSYAASISKNLSESVSFSTASNNAVLIANGDTNVQPWVNNEIPYASALSTPSSYSPDSVFADLYDDARSSWTSWVRNAESISR